MHDIEEAVFGDIPTPAKHLAPAVIEAGNKIRLAIWRSHGVRCTTHEWEYIKESDHVALITEARDLMHPNIQRFVPFDRDYYIPQIFPLMNEDDIVNQFLDRYNDVSGIAKQELDAAAYMKSLRTA
jgi:5'-deoxynucleotidase YfbR-like HD superfamily hydrolase